MNYKIMAASVVVTGAILVTSISLTTGDRAKKSEIVERLSTVDIAEAPASYPIASRPPPSEPPISMAQDSITEPSAPPDASSAGFNSVQPMVVGIPQIAYRFGYGFRLQAGSIKPLQDRHADQCEAKGIAICRIISMAQVDGEGDGDGDGATGNLQLAVASPYARKFGKELTNSVTNAHGELVSSSIDGEDLSKSIVDTEARLRARTVLRDRLLEVLRSRKGSVAELVEAERGVAQVNEEIDQARSWLTEMKGRVQFSHVSITYETAPPVAQEGFADPIFSAWSAIGSILGSLLAFILIMASIFGPIAALAWLALAVWRRLGRPRILPNLPNNGEPLEASG